MFHCKHVTWILNLLKYRSKNLIYFFRFTRHLILGYWGYAFALSKLVEFGDTFFIVLRKQPLIFLHWYHHIVTFLYGWFLYIDEAEYAKWFAIINAIIHSFMYTYYTFKAMGYRLPKWLSIMITSIQLSQMFVGIFLAIAIYYYVRIAKLKCRISSLIQPPCSSATPRNIVWPCKRTFARYLIDSARLVVNVIGQTTTLLTLPSSFLSFTFNFFFFFFFSVRLSASEISDDNYLPI